jgi:hypothetical protein
LLHGVVGLILLSSGSWVWGIILLIVAALVGPGGYSIFGHRSAKRSLHAPAASVRDGRAMECGPSLGATAARGCAAAAA